MQHRCFFTIEKFVWHLLLQSETNLICIRNFGVSVSLWKFKAQMLFLDSENALFEKFFRQKTAFHTENKSVKADSKNGKLFCHKVNRIALDRLKHCKLRGLPKEKASVLCHCFPNYGQSWSGTFRWSKRRRTNL